MHWQHTVKSGDTCADIALKYSVTPTIIENSNKNTFGWRGAYWY